MSDFVPPPGFIEVTTSIALPPGAELLTLEVDDASADRGRALAGVWLRTPPKADA